MDGCVAINFAANSNFRGYCIVAKAIASQPPVDMVDLLYRAKRRGYGGGTTRRISLAVPTVPRMQMRRECRCAALLLNSAFFLAAIK
jgi:hypothetical protein